MGRWLVVFRSHHEALADEHFVDVDASHALAALRLARKLAPPPFDWALGRAVAWPRGIRDVDDYAELAVGG
jgi:hypothetical protein